MSKQEIESLFMQRTLQTSIGLEFDDLIGPLDFIILQRETLLGLKFPFSDGIFLVICDLKVISNFLAKKISYMFRDFKWRLKDPLYA